MLPGETRIRAIGGRSRSWPKSMPLLCRISLALLLVMLGLSLAISPWPGASLRAALPLAAGLAIYLSVVCLVPRRWLTRELWWALIVLGMTLAVAAPLGMRQTLPIWLRRLMARTFLPRSFSSAFNANVIAGYMVLLWPLGVTKALAVPVRGTRRWLLRGAAALGSLLTLITLFLSGSRGAAVAAMGAGLLGALLAWPRRAYLVALGALLAAAVAGSLIGWDTVLRQLSNGGLGMSLEQRGEIWSRALVLLHDLPFTGVGFDNYRRLVALRMPLMLMREPTVSHAHNLYLQIALDLGLPGLAAVLALVGASVRAALSGLRHQRAHDRACACLALACVVSLAGLGLHGLIDAAVWNNKGAFLPWLVMAIALALGQAASVEDGAHDH